MMRWSDGSDLWLLTKEEYDQLPDGIELGCINGRNYVKGKDYLDDDTRSTYMAFGIHAPFEHELKELFMEFYFKSKQ